MNQTPSPSASQRFPQSGIWPIVIAWGNGDHPSVSQRQRLAEWTLAPQNQASIWHQSLDSVSTVTEVLARRAELLQLTVQGLARRPQTLPLPGPWQDWIVPLWTFWLPLAQQLDQKQRTLKAPFIQGVLGGQGTGKTTLTQILQLILGHLGHSTGCLSIDDLYLTYAQRLERQQQDPRLIWRGPPGTHDISLGLQTLRQIKTASPGSEVTLPRFDKSQHGGQGDRTTPITLSAPTILLFEGWFVGVQPAAGSLFTDPNVSLPAPINTNADRQFAADSNRRLHEYLPLWDFLDSLIVLCPEDYHQSQQWRQQAEQKMKAQGKSGLSDEEIADFVTYFWKALHPSLFITPLTQHPNTHLVVNIRSDHSLGKLYTPKARESGSQS